MGVPVPHTGQSDSLLMKTINAHFSEVCIKKHFWLDCESESESLSSLMLLSVSQHHLYPLKLDFYSRNTGAICLYYHLRSNITQ